MKKTVLLIIDMQSGLLMRDVLHKQILIDNIRQLLKYTHRSMAQAVFVRHTNQSFSKKNSDEWQITNELALSGTDIVIDKTHSSVFKEKAFLNYLCSNEIKRVVICGLVSNGCVQAACIDAKKNGLETILISDAHSTWHKNAQNVIDDWNNRLFAEGITVKSTSEYIR